MTSTRCTRRYRSQQSMNTGTAAENNVAASTRLRHGVVPIVSVHRCPQKARPPRPSPFSRLWSTDQRRHMRRLPQLCVRRGFSLGRPNAAPDGVGRMLEQCAVAGSDDRRRGETESSPPSRLLPHQSAPARHLIPGCTCLGAIPETAVINSRASTQSRLSQNSRGFATRMRQPQSNWSATCLSQ
jgi:hypothetical protein